MAYMAFELEDGTKVYVETTDAHRGSSGFPTMRGEGDASSGLVQKFEQSMAGVKKMASTLMSQFRENVPNQPSEIEISFGLKASGELGSFLVARSGVEANYSVTLKWKKE